MRAAGLTHIRRSSTRARVLLYIRPPCPRREIAAMGPKDAPASTHRPRRLSHPPRPRLHFRARVHTSPVCVCTSPSAFTLPPHRLPRPPQNNRPPAAAVIHNGLSTEKLSTSLPAGLCKTFSPSRLRTRIYKYRSPVGCSRGVSASLRKRVRAVAPPCPAPPCAGWGRAKVKADAPSRSAEPCRLCAESLCAKAECTRQTPPLPVRSPRGNLSTAVPPPADGRSAERRVGEGEGKGRAPLHSNPPLSAYRPAPAA